MLLEQTQRVFGQSQGQVSKVAITAGPFVVTAIWATRQRIRDIREGEEQQGQGRNGMLPRRQRDGLIGFLQAE